MRNIYVKCRFWVIGYDGCNYIGLYLIVIRFVYGNFDGRFFGRCGVYEFGLIVCYFWILVGCGICY